MVLMMMVTGDDGRRGYSEATKTPSQNASVRECILCAGCFIHIQNGVPWFLRRFTGFWFSVLLPIFFVALLLVTLLFQLCVWVHHQFDFMVCSFLYVFYSSSCLDITSTKSIFFCSVTFQLVSELNRESIIVLFNVLRVG